MSFGQRPAAHAGCAPASKRPTRRMKDQMKSIALSLSVLVAACTADVAFSMESSPTQGVARATGAPADVPLRAAVPMIYKTYGTAGARSSWDAQRSSTVVLQNVGSDAAVGTICFYASVADGTPVSAQTFEQCYSLPAIRPGASYPVELDTLAEIGGGFRGSALIYSLGEVSAIGAHKFADTSNFLAISTADAITPDAAGGRTYVPTFYADFDGALSTHAMSALFAQNLDALDNQVDVQFFTIGSSLPALSRSFSLAPGRSAVLDAPGLFSSFNGSAIVTARRSDGSPGVVGAHVFELARGGAPN